MTSAYGVKNTECPLASDSLCASRNAEQQSAGTKPMLELYHTVNSVCAQKVRVQLAEKALDWKSHLMTLRGDQFEPAYLKLNPEWGCSDF